MSLLSKFRDRAVRCDGRQHVNAAFLQVSVEESLEANYTCTRCLRIFQDPVACVPCGHVYCRACVTDASAGKAGPRCPECAVGSLVSTVVPLGHLDRLCTKFEFKLGSLRDLQALCEHSHESAQVAAEGSPQATGMPR
jgi:RING-type zinc-finger